jgi:branched-subunit amino acid ABC-type transport system permease component
MRRSRAVLVGLLVGVTTALTAWVPSANAATTEPIDPATSEESISVWIRQTSDKAGIEGVALTVTGDDFDGAFTTDAEGRVAVGLPGPGTYTVEIDPATIPETSGTLPEGSSPREVEVAATNKNVPANFLASTTAGGSSAPAPSSSAGTGASTGTDGTGSTDGSGAVTPDATSSGVGFWGIALSKLVTGLIFGLLLALAAIGASLIYGTTGLNNFAHGELVTFGGLVAFTAATLGAPGWLGIILAIVFGGLFGFLQDALIWKPLRRKRVGLIPLMIVSIGLALATRYVYVFFFGADRLSLPNNPSPFLVLGPVSLRFTDVMGALVAAVVLVAVAFVMLRTKLGKAARAVSDNPSLASASGINVDSVIRSVWIGAAALAGLSGVLIAYYQSLRWDTGSAILLLIFAAVTLGGLGSAFGALVGSIVLGVFMNLATLVIPENLKYAAALVILIVILLFRPQGILGKRERIG